MILWLKPPKLIDISKYIESYWYLEKLEDGGYERPKLNPDPCAHLLLSLSTQCYQYDINDEIYNGKGSHWLYPHCKTVELDHAKSFSFLGVKFKVGALYSLNSAHNSGQKSVQFSQALSNTVKGFDFEHFKGPSLLSENELITKANNEPDKCIEMLDKLFMPLFTNAYEDKHSEITRRVIPLLKDNPINELGDMLHCSQRTLERSFLKVTGFTLKQCKSMNKLESILEYLYQRKLCDIDWVDIAYQFGFSDQPHLIRYLKQQINLTPKNYTQQRGLTIDVYGGGEFK